MDGDKTACYKNGGSETHIYSHTHTHNPKLRFSVTIGVSRQWSSTFQRDHFYEFYHLSDLLFKREMIIMKIPPDCLLLFTLIVQIINTINTDSNYCDKGKIILSY